MKPSTTATCLAALVFLFASAALHAQSPPANDDFANRQILPSETHVTVAGTTDYATQEPFEKVYGAGASYGYGINETNTVWSSYTPPVSGIVHLSATRDIASESYTLVFQGGATPVAAAIVSQGYLPGDPADGDLTPANFKVTAGQEYDISLGTTPPTPTTDDNFILTLVLTPSATPTPTSLPVASVAAKSSKADRAANTPGKLVFTLSAAASTDVTVAYKVSGSAAAGTDYKALSGSATFAAGQTSTTVKVKPRAATGTGSSEPTVAVKVKLQTGDGYTVGPEAVAKIKITDGQ